MREIKFRAWHNKQMAKDVGVYGGQAADDATYTFDTPNIEVVKLWDAILMQYTGLKDKNGVEIYEGDIVDARTDDVWQDACRDVTNLVVVEWLAIGYYKGFLGYSKGEVIGNIYENPELMEAENGTL